MDHQGEFLIVEWQLHAQEHKTSVLKCMDGQELSDGGRDLRIGTAGAGGLVDYWIGGLVHGWSGGAVEWRGEE